MTNQPNETSLDQLCSQFESAWVDGDSPPDLHDWLNRHHETPSRDLLISLLRVDVKYRREADQDFLLPDYLQQFGIGEEELKSRPLVGDETQVAPNVPAPSEGAGRNLSPSQIGRFRIIREIGRGGFGRVFLAIDESLGREVALKIPRALVSDDTVLRLQKEASLVALLEHPGIVPVHEAGNWDGEFYVVSAFCPGENLSHWIAQQEGVTPRTAAMLIRRLAEATDHAHNRGVVHRDLKPGNVMMVPAGDKDSEFPYTPRITDFGLAKLVQQRMEDTNSSQMLGTPSYMAPEQFSSREVTLPFAADIYALGVILYELLTGRRPHEGKTFPEVMDAVRNEKIQLPSELAPHVPRDLETICLKCLRFHATERYESAAMLAQDLSLFLRGEFITARRRSPGERFHEWLRSPARRYEAGVMSIFAGFGVPIWISVMITLIWKEGLEASVGRELFPQATALFLFVLFPLGYAGIRTIQGSRGWMWFAFIQCILALFQVVPPLFGVVFVFPELYARYPLGRIIAYSAVTLLFSLQIVQYFALIWANKSSTK